MVQIKADEKAAKVIVPDYQLSLAIGKEGQNARLAAKLTGWKIDIKSQTQSEEEVFGKMDADEEAQNESAESEEPINEEELPAIDEGEIEEVLSEDFDLKDEI
jgi:N utilization substance protein A